MSDDEEEELLAQGLVAKALHGYERVLPRRKLEDIRSYLVDELLCTSYGRERLARFRGMSPADASAEIIRENEVLSQLKKDSAS